MAMLLAFALVFTVITSAHPMEPGQPSGDGTVKADVMYWEGEELVVKEMSGRELRLRVTPDTKIEGVVSRLKTGDKISAQVNAEGRALSITLQVPDGGASVTPPGLR